MNHPRQLSSVRNIGIAAHVDAGKTTLTERILFYTGAVHKIGEVHEGAAHMDWMVEEQTHGITITAAVTQAPWRNHLLQVVDTPGHVDFTIEVERSMRVLDGVIIVLDGVRGVEPQTETVWRQRARFGLPTLFFVNKMDRPGADFNRALAAVRARLGARPVAVTVPLPAQEAVVDLIDCQLLRFVGAHGERVEAVPCPADLWASVVAAREELLLAAAEADETLADLVLTGAEPPRAQVVAALRRGTLAGTLFPCYGGSALRNQGVQPLLDGVVDFLPAPLDRPPAIAVRPDGSHETVAIGTEGPLVALIFKVQLWEGRRHCFARIYRQRLRPGAVVEWLGTDGRIQRETVARIFAVDAAHRTPLDEAGPGQIVLLGGLRHATTGDTLCEPGHVLCLERIAARQPVLSLAIEPLSREDEEPLLTALDKIVQEDPTLQLAEDPDTGQRLLKGMGELHLQIVLERLQREFHLRVRSGRPAVAVRETVTRAATATALYTRPPSPDGKHPEWMAGVTLSVAPLPRGTGIRIGGALLTSPPPLRNERKAAARPAGSKSSTMDMAPVLTAEQRAALEQGVRQALGAGPLQAAPLEDVAVEVQAVEMFGAASVPEALAAAASKALRQALAAAAPRLLQPVMRLEVSTPDARFGAVLGDLQARHALIHATATSDGEARITAEAPLAELLGYATALRSLTQGRGQFSMQFERFD